MWGLDAKVDTQNSEQITNLYQESNEYTDSSIRDTLINSYINNITQRNEDYTELMKNFEANVDACADATQRNTLNFGVCMDITDFKLEQKNELVQNVEQGFQQLNEDIKTLKKATAVDMSTESDVQQSLKQGQTSEQGTEQGATSQQEGIQDTKQESFVSSFTRPIKEVYNRTRRAVKDTFTPKPKPPQLKVDLRTIEHYSPFLEHFSAWHRRFGENPARRRLYNFDNEHKYEQQHVGSRLTEYVSNGAMTNIAKDTTLNKSVHDVYASQSVSKDNAKTEPFCLFGCVGVDVAVKNEYKETNETQKDYKTNIQTQDIYEKIETAYNKCVETVNKIVEEIDQTNNSMANAQAVQINELNFNEPRDICMMKVKNMDIKQSNTLTQNVVLTTMITSITSLTNDTEVQAIMSDMLGLTQGVEAEQTTVQTSKQTASSSQKSSQTTVQSTSQAGGIVLIIVIAVVAMAALFLMMKSGGSFDSYFDGPVNTTVNNFMGPINNMRNRVMGPVPGQMRGPTMPGQQPVQQPVQRPVQQPLQPLTTPVAQQPDAFVQQPVQQPISMPTMPTQQPMYQPLQEPLI